MAILSFVLFYVGLALRFIIKEESSFSTARLVWMIHVDEEANRHDEGTHARTFQHQIDFAFHSRIVMAWGLEIFWLQSLSFLIVFKELGPNLVAIRKMVASVLPKQSCQNSDDALSDQNFGIFLMHHYHRYVWLWNHFACYGLLSSKGVFWKFEYQC
jgi:hypothetical protein